ncbi:hypothetical protein LTR15_011518 [Elasticomyces elasticus]|nr:hypothetical protein LTR15_011518 [Elasticomyces elasticus]
MAEITVFSLTTALLSDLWFDSTGTMGWIPLIIFWLLCIAAVATTSVGAVKIWYRLVTKSVESPYSILGKMERCEVERKPTHYLLTIAPPVLSLGWMLFVCIRALERALFEPEQWPGHVTLGLSCVWAVLITHIIVVGTAAFGCLIVNGGQCLLGTIQNQAPVKPEAPTEATATDVSWKTTNGSQHPIGAKQARATATPSTTTASSTQARDTSEDTMAGWRSWESTEEEMRSKKAEAEALLDHRDSVFNALRAKYRC